MPLPLFGFYALLPAFMLVLCRVGGLMLTAQVFSSIALPVQVRVFLAVAVSLAVFPMTVPYLPMQVSLAGACAGLLGELAIGLLLGLAVQLVFTGLEMAAEMVGQMSGMRLGEVFNPMLEASAGALGELYTLVAMMAFIAVRGDHALIRALLDSFQTIPPLGFAPTEGLLALVLDMLELAFTLTIRIGGPMALALMLSFMTIGFLSRTIPQLHLMSIGFPLKAAVGLSVAALTFVSMESVLVEGFREAFDSIRAGLGLGPSA
jgi:flagellar biosynthesis protein FliR